MGLCPNRLKIWPKKKKKDHSVRPATCIYSPLELNHENQSSWHLWLFTSFLSASKWYKMSEHLIFHIFGGNLENLLTSVCCLSSTPFPYYLIIHPQDLHLLNAESEQMCRALFAQYFTLLHEFHWIPLKSHGMLEFHSDSARMVGIKFLWIPLDSKWNLNGIWIEFLNLRRHVTYCNFQKWCHFRKKKFQELGVTTWLSYYVT